MPRITGTQVDGSSGFTGRGQVIDCYTMVDLPKKRPEDTFEPKKSLGWYMQVQPLGVDGSILMEEPKLVVAKFSQKAMDPTDKLPFTYAVGYAKDRNDPNPQFVGTDPGSKGNTIYVNGPTGRPRNSAFDHFFKSLEHFIPAAAVDAMQCEEFIGMVADFTVATEIMTGGEMAGKERRWPEVTAVLAMPACPDFANPASAPVGAQTPKPQAPALAPPPPPRPPMPPQVAGATHAAPPAPPARPVPPPPPPAAPQPTPQPTASNVASVVEILNVLRNCAAAGVFVPTTYYTQQSLIATVTPKVMIEPAIGGATPQIRAALSQGIRTALMNPETWAQVLDGAATAGDGKIASAGDGVHLYAF